MPRPGSPHNDDSAEPLMDTRLDRPYRITGGRTAPAVDLDRLTYVWASQEVSVNDVEPEHAEVLYLCREPIAVIEIAARLRLLFQVVRVLLSDLIEAGAVQALSTKPYDEEVDEYGNERPSRAVLEAVLEGLQKRL